MTEAAFPGAGNAEGAGQAGALRRGEALRLPRSLFVCRDRRGDQAGLKLNELAPPDMVKQLKGLFDKARERHDGNGGELEIQMGVHHGFAFPERWCYDKPAAERHWERLIALYRRRIG